MEQNVTIPAIVLNRSDFVFPALYEWIVQNDGSPYVVVNTMIDGVVADPSKIDPNGRITYNLSPGATQNLLIKDGFVSFDARFNGKIMSISFPCMAICVIFDNNERQINEMVNHPEVQQWVIENGGSKSYVDKEPVKEEPAKRPSFLSVVK